MKYFLQKRVFFKILRDSVLCEDSVYSIYDWFGVVTTIYPFLLKFYIINYMCKNVSLKIKS